MAVIELEVLLRSFPQVQEGESVLALDLGLRHMSAQLYTIQGDSHVLAYHQDDHHRLNTEIQLLMAGLNDPLLDRIILDLGLFWTPEREITLDDIIECYLPLLDKLLADLHAQVNTSHLILLGDLCLEERLLRRILTVFPQPKEFDTGRNAHPTWSLADVSQVKRDLETLKAMMFQDYYDLIALRVSGKALSWERKHLFYPGMEKPYFENHVLHLAPGTQSIYLWVARFSDDNSSFDFDSFDTSQLVTALEVRGLDGRRELRFSARLTADGRVPVTVNGLQAQQVMQNRISGIYDEERRQVRERSVPVETAILFDQTMVPRVYDRVKRLLIDLISHHQSSDRWLTYFYDPRICTPLGSLTRFVKPGEMINTIQEHLYKDVYSRNDFVTVTHALRHLSQLEWHGREANYFILFTHHPPGDESFQMNTENLFNKYGIQGIVIWLKSLELMEAKERENQVTRLIPHPGRAIFFNDLESEAGRLEIRQQLLNLLVPAVTKELDLTALHWPLLDNITY